MRRTSIAVFTLASAMAFAQAASAADLGQRAPEPLPPPELLSTLPQHRSVFETLADYDLVGVQTPADLQALQDYFVRVVGARG